MMGQKKINQIWLLKNGVMTGTSTITSPAEYLGNFDSVGLEVTWTGTPNGTFSVLGSISAIGQFNISGTISSVPAISYYALTFNPALTQPTGTAGGYLIDLSQYPFPYIEVQYVNTSSTGVLNVYLFGKDLN